MAYRKDSYQLSMYGLGKGDQPTHCFSFIKDGRVYYQQFFLLITSTEKSLYRRLGDYGQASTAFFLSAVHRSLWRQESQARKAPTN